MSPLRECNFPANEQIQTQDTLVIKSCVCNTRPVVICKNNLETWKKEREVNKLSNNSSNNSTFSWRVWCTRLLRWWNVWNVIGLAPKRKWRKLYVFKSGAPPSRSLCVQYYTSRKTTEIIELISFTTIVITHTTLNSFSKRFDYVEFHCLQYNMAVLNESKLRHVNSSRPQISVRIMKKKKPNFRHWLY